jgi:predicted GH43/DUF377 family glycosyl hydrolase
MSASVSINYEEAWQSVASIKRGGLLITPDSADPREVEGVFNPAVAGDYLIYRAAARDNYSRLLLANLHQEQTKSGYRVWAEKTGRAVLEPEQPYEITHDGKGGIEDPRITPLTDGTYAMFYTGYGRPSTFTRRVPVVALALSRDGLTWERQGLITFAPYRYGGHVIDFNAIPNKDTLLFSEKLNGRYALFFRPMFSRQQSAQLGVPWRAIWYADADNLLGPWINHRVVLVPKYEWEGGGVGGGIPPIHLGPLWLHVYHGFTKKKLERRYSAGVFATPHDLPGDVVFRSREPLLEPHLPAEEQGTVPRVVFPTAAWHLTGLDDGLAVFWGGADTNIMWGVMRVPFVKAVPSVQPRHTP